MALGQSTPYGWSMDLLTQMAYQQAHRSDDPEGLAKKRPLDQGDGESLLEQLGGPYAKRPCVAGISCGGAGISCGGAGISCGGAGISCGGAGISCGGAGISCGGADHVNGTTGAGGHPQLPTEIQTSLLPTFDLDVSMDTEERVESVDMPRPHEEQMGSGPPCQDWCGGEKSPGSGKVRCYCLPTWNGSTDFMSYYNTDIY